MIDEKQTVEFTSREFEKFEFSEKLSDRKKHYKKPLGLGIKHEKSGAVKIRVKDIKDLIEAKGLGDNDKLVFHFAAYKKEDYPLYQEKSWVDAYISEKEFAGRPTIVLSYQTNQALRAEAYDVGELCPPPEGSTCDDYEEEKL